MKRVFLFFLGLIISLSVVLILQPKTAEAQVACTSNADCTNPSSCQPNCNDADCIPRNYCSCRNSFCVQSCDFNPAVCIENGGTQCGTVICSDCGNPYTCAPCPIASTCSNTAPNDKFRVCYFNGTNPDTGTASDFKHEEDEPGIPSPVGNYGQYVIYHDWAYGQIDSTNLSDNVSGKWRGRLNFVEGTYQFFIDHDDGVTLDLDGYGRIIDQWSSVGMHWSSLINLPAGYRNLTVRWYEAGGAAAIKLIWNYNAPPSPTVDIKANNSDGPISINYNTSANLTWSSTNANSCTASGSWTGSKATSNSTGESTGNLTSSKTYTLTCCKTGAGLCSSDSVTVNVGAAPPAPTVSISASPNPVNYNSSSTITWSSTNATSCSVSLNSWTGTSGSQSTGALTSSTTYTATCTGAGGSASNSVIVSVNAQSCSCTAWTNGSCGVGGCSASQRQQTRTCTPAACSAQSQCVTDSTCGSPTSMDFSLSNQGNKTVFKGETVPNIFTASWLSGTSEAVNLNFTALPSNVSSVFYRGGNLASDSCTPPVSGSCTSETRFTPSSTGLSGNVTVTGTTATYSRPNSFTLTVWDLPAASTTATCTNSSTSYNISWGGQTAPAGSYADISTDSTFATYYHKDISGTTSTTAPSGFTYYNSAQLLTLNPSTTYYIRLYINGVNNSTLESFITPAICPMDFSITNVGNQTVFQGESSSQTFRVNNLTPTTTAQQVDLSISSPLPIFVSRSFSPASCTPPASSFCTSPTITTIDSAGTVGQGSSVAIDPGTGFPIISYSKPGDSIRVTKCGNATCSSGNTTTVIASGANYNAETSIAINANGDLLVGYLINTGSSGSLTIFKCNSTDCSTGTGQVVYQTSTGPGPNYVSITVPATGDRNPVVTYSPSSSSTRLIKCGNASCSSGNIDTSIGSGNDRPPIKAVIGTDGFPVVPFVNASDGTFHVVHCGNAGCTAGNTNSTVDSSSTNGGSSGGVAIGSDGLPIISYYDNNTLDLVVVHCGNISCSSNNTKTKVDTTGNVGSYSSIAKGADGLAVIAFYDATNKDLRIFHCSNINCTTGTATSIDTTGDVGSYPSIAIGADNLPVISYYDATNGDLKVFKCSTAACDIIGNLNTPIPTLTLTAGATATTGTTTQTIRGTNAAYTHDQSFNLSVFGQPAISGAPVCLAPAANPYTVSWGTATPTPPTTTTVDSTGTVGQGSSVAIDPASGFPIISYSKPGDSIRVTKCGNATCSSGNTTTVIASGSNFNAETSIAIGSDGLPLVGYLINTGSSGSLTIVKCGNDSCSSGNTSSVVYSVASGSPGPDYVSIAKGTNGNPVIAYSRSSSSTRLIQCGNASCSSGNIDTSIGSGNDRPPIKAVIGTDGFPVVPFTNASDGTFHVVHCGNAGCTGGNTNTTVDSGSTNGGSSGGVVIGSDGLPIISYYDNNTLDLVVVHCGNISCSSNNTKTKVDTTGNVGSYSSIAKGADGLAVIAFYDATNKDLRIFHCNNVNCTTGTATSIETAGDVGSYPFIAIGSDNLPFVSYYDATNADMKAVKCSTAACDVSRSWADISTGSSPTPTTVDTTGPGLSTSSAIGSDGLPVISYIVGGTSLRVTKCGNASCSSGNITKVVSTASNIQRETSIAIGRDELPVITFIAESAGNGLLVVKCGNATCDPGGNPGNTTTVVFPITGPPAPEMGSIAIGTNGNPVIAYQRSSSSTRLILCGNTACSSGNTDILLGTGNERNARVAVGTDGVPIIAYRDAAAGSAKAVHCGNAGCASNNITTTLDSSGVGHMGGISIAGGLPVISYYDSTNGDLKFIRCGNARCDSGNATTTVDSIGDVGNYSSVAIGTDGLPFISYYDATAGKQDLRVAKCNTPDCSLNTKTSVDTTGNVGQYTSVAIGSDNLPFISYYDATNTAMKAIKCSTAACDGAPSWINNYYHKDISGLSSTTAPGGFGYFDGSKPDLTLSPNTPYFVRLFINGVNNTTANSFTTPTASCVTATCTGSPITAKAGDTVTWTAVPSGGGPSYTYSWSGTDLLSGTINPVTKTYSSLGTKSASVTVSDNTSSITSACSNTVFVNTPAFIRVEGDVHSQTGINAN